MDTLRDRHHPRRARRGRAGLAAARCGLGRVYLAQNKPHDAYRCFLSALTTPGLSPDSAERCAAIIGLGDAEHARMAFAAAIPHYERAIGLVVSQRAHAALAGVHASLGLCLAMLNRLEDADRHADFARGLARFAEARELEAKARGRAGDRAEGTVDRVSLGVPATNLSEPPSSCLRIVVRIGDQGGDDRSGAQDGQTTNSPA